MEAGASEPSPRFAPFTAFADGQFCVWGGRTKDFSKGRDATVHLFSPQLETWSSKSTTVSPPPGLYGGACNSQGGKNVRRGPNNDV